MDTKKQSRLTRIQLKGYQMIEKKVHRSGSSGRVYLPVEWIDKTVKIVLLQK